MAYNTSRNSSRPEYRGLRAVMLTAALGLAAGPTKAEIDPEAAGILRAMADHLAGLQQASFQADVDNEVIDLAGQKLQLSSSVEIELQRPDKLYIHRQGPFADAEFYFAGQALTILGRRINAYLQIDARGTIDNAVDAVRNGIGLDAPGADLLVADPYPALTEEATAGTYRGTAYVNGVPCDYLTFRGDRADWQIWVQQGDMPLPMKYVITTKWLTGAPQYSVRFRSWDTAAAIDASRFAFKAPKGARKLDVVAVDETGELLLEGGEK